MRNNFILLLFIFAVMGSFNLVNAAVIFSDDFESGTLSGWTLSSASGANNFTSQSTNPFGGTRHAEANPTSTTEPASVMERIISTEGYRNISFSYYRRLISIDAADEFQVEYNYGTGWNILEQTAGGTADDANYSFKNFTLAGGASNYSTLQIKFECTAGAVSEYCRIDNITLKGDVIPVSDSTTPNVTINSPGNQTFSTNSIIFNVTAVDNLGLTNCSYTLNNGVNNYTMKNISTSPTYWNASNASVNQGSITARFYCYDINNNLNDSETKTFFVDSLTPSISIVTPVNRTNSSNVNLDINYTRNDTNLVSCWYSNDTYSTNRSLGDGICGNLTNLTWSEGSHNVTIYANDSAGNLMFSSVTFTLDSVNPGINYSSGTVISGKNQSFQNIFVNVSVSETNEQAIVFRLFFTNGTLVNRSQFSAGVRTINWTNLIDEDYHFNVSVNDSFGNTNSTETRSVTIDTLNPGINVSVGSSVSGNQSSSNIFVNVSVSETNEQAIVFRLFYSNGSLFNVSLFTNQQRTINFTGLNDGTFIYNVSVNDSAGNINLTESRSVSVDTVSPTANFVSLTETNGSTIGRNSILVNVSASDSGSGLNAIVIRLYNSSHTLINSTLSMSSPHFVNLSGLSDGLYYFNASVNDSLNNVGHLGTMNVSVDLTQPNVVINFPGNQSYSQSSISVNASLNERGSCLYSFNNGLTNYSMTANSSQTGFNATNSSIADGSYRLNVYCNDSVGNVNYTETRDFVIDSGAPTITYGDGTTSTGVNQTLTNIFVNVSVNEDNEQAIVFRLFFTNGTLVNRSQFSAGTRTINWTNLINEDYHFNVTVNDSAGNKASTSTRAVSVDTVVPIISVIFPTNNSNFSNINLDVNFTRSDLNLGSCWYSNDSFSVNTTVSSCANITAIVWSEGSHNVIVYVNDSAGNENYARITFTIDTTSPSVNIINPSNGSTLGNNVSLSLNFSISEPNLFNCWYVINNGNNISVISCLNTTFNVSGDGTYNLTVFANDSVGQIGRTTHTFTITIGAPTITLHSPINDHVGSGVFFNYTPSDPELGSCELWGDFSGIFLLNKSMSPVNNAVNQFNLTLDDGTYLWNVRCNDTLGYATFDGNKTFYVDTIKPTISLTGPTGTKTNRSNISLQFAVNDTWNVSCLYNVYRGVNVEIANTSIDCHANLSTFNVTVDADFIVNFYSNDSAGNLQSSSLSFTVSTSGDSGSGGSSGGGGGGGGGGSGGGSGGNNGGGGLVVKKIAQFNFSEIKDIISYPGDKKTLSLNLKNTGSLFLNNCKLIFLGNISSWIYSDQVKGIAPGENANFVFDVNVPEGIDEKKYEGIMEVRCDEIAKLQTIVIDIPSGSKNIRIKDVKQHKNDLNISYDFDYTPIVGDDVSVDVWLVDQDGKEVLRQTDRFSIKKDDSIERKINFKLNKNIIGVYTLYFALSSEPESFVKQTVVIGKSAGLGLVIFGGDRAKIVGYGVFVLVVLIGMILILRNVMISKAQPKYVIKKGLFH